MLLRRSLSIVVVWGAVSVPSIARAGGGGIDPSLGDARTDSLDPSHAALRGIELPADPHASFVVELELGGVVETAVVWPHSVRSTTYSLTVQGAGGVVREATPSPPSTYRGVLVGRPSSRVAASLTDEGLLAWIRRGPDDVWGVQLVDGEHVVYRDDDTPTLPGGCVLVAAGGGDRTDHPGPSAESSSGDGDGPWPLEIGFDVDVEQFHKNGGTVAASEADVEALVNAVGVIFEEDLNLAPVIAKLIVRTAEPDPYESTQVTALLFEVKGHWQGPQGGVERDVAHLLTGKVIDGFPLGGAFLNGVCDDSLGYGVTESSFTRDYTLRVALLSHELGHGLGASHCDGAATGCQIMCSGTDGFCREVTGFAQKSINKISNFVADAECITGGGEPEPDVPPELKAVVPASIPSLLPGPSQSVALVGEALSTVTEVTVDGVALPSFPAFTVSENEIRIDMPQLDHLGPVVFRVSGAIGADEITAEVVPASPPTLQLGAGNDPELLTSIAPIGAHVGGEALSVAIVFGSLELAPTVFPGLVSFDIGGGPEGLIVLASATIDAAGWVETSLGTANLVPGTAVYFQAVVYDPVTAGAPLESTNVQTGLFLF